MITHNGAWLPTILFGVPGVILATLVLAAIMSWCVVHEFDDETDAEFVGGGGFISAGVIMVILVIASAIGYWPYDGDYHRLQPVTGTVAAVDSRFLAASQYVVITYKEGATVRCDDSRCATVRVGDNLRLLCTKEYEYGAVNGWGCRWGQK